ncbi:MULTISPECIES: DUF6712 family protein [Dysgonomonas]|uniref:DUF6712 family protein n=1 Tax=Dysgonomonas TaxID=156973 RepID=UPI00092AC5F8|nr:MULTISPECIES: DUF6712 family protein [Dysgonomonas]MBN9303253.1 hypothetical protein [Dysgonomonas mossii]OJX60498.1 MAG: hypothetical protein BGO84_08975 [Dysgonomonas sp. 37-18]
MNEYIQIPLITESLFKQHSPVTANTDITEFVPYICIAQELHIEPVLGEALMTELKAQITENTLTAYNSDLIVRLAPALSFYAVYQALPFHWATIVNKGITIRESENSKAVDIKDLAQLRQWIKNDADVLKNQLMVFLSKFSAHYPLWRPQDGCCDKVMGEGSGRKSFDSGFHFKGKRKGC